MTAKRVAELSACPFRRGKGKYSPSKIDEELCTHIVYGFTVLHPSEYTIKTHDPWADVDNGEGRSATASGPFISKISRVSCKTVQYRQESSRRDC